MQPDNHSVATDPEGTDQQTFEVQQDNPVYPWIRRIKKDYEDSSRGEQSIQRPQKSNEKQR